MSKNYNKIKFVSYFANTDVNYFFFLNSLAKLIKNILASLIWMLLYRLGMCVSVYIFWNWNLIGDNHVDDI